MMYTATEVYNQLLNGLTPSEIKRMFSMTDREWLKLMASTKFNELLHSSKTVPDSLKLREIEDNLFGLLEGPRTIGVNKRIDALTKRYAKFLL